MSSIILDMQCVREEIRRRRKELKLDYRVVVARIIRHLYQIECDESEITTVSEDWLKRLEIGRPASMTANILDGLLRALEYSDRERVEWLLRAHYSPIASGDVEKAINYVAYLLNRNPIAVGLIASATADGQGDRLTDNELLEIIAKSLTLVLQDRRRQ